MLAHWTFEMGLTLPRWYGEDMNELHSCHLSNLLFWASPMIFLFFVILYCFKDFRFEEPFSWHLKKYSLKLTPHRNLLTLCSKFEILLILSIEVSDAVK
jgi:hypothetical protein